MIIEGKVAKKEKIIVWNFRRDLLKKDIKFEILRQAVRELIDKETDENLKIELEKVHIILVCTYSIVLARNQRKEIEIFFDAESFGRKKPELTLRGHKELFKVLDDLIQK